MALIKLVFISLFPAKEKLVPLAKRGVANIAVVPGQMLGSPIILILKAG